MPRIGYWDFEDGTRQGWSIPSECQVIDGEIKCSYNQVDSVSLTLTSPVLQVLGNKWYMLRWLVAASSGNAQSTISLTASASVLSGGRTLYSFSHSYSKSAAGTVEARPTFSYLNPVGGDSLEIRVNLSLSQTDDVTITIDNIELWEPDIEVLLAPRYVLFSSIYTAADDIDVVRIGPYIYHGCSNVGGYPGYLNNNAETLIGSQYVTNQPYNDYVLKEFSADYFDISVIEEFVGESRADLFCFSDVNKQLVHIHFLGRASKLYAGPRFVPDSIFQATPNIDVTLPGPFMSWDFAVQNMYPDRYITLQFQYDIQCYGENKEAEFLGLDYAITRYYSDNPFDITVVSESRARASQNSHLLKIEYVGPESQDINMYRGVIYQPKLLKLRAGFGTCLVKVKFRISDTNYDYYMPKYTMPMVFDYCIADPNERLQCPYIYFMVVPANVHYLDQDGNYIAGLNEIILPGAAIGDQSFVYVIPVKLNTPLIAGMGNARVAEEYHSIRNPYGVRVTVTYVSDVPGILYDKHGNAVRIIKPGETFIMEPAQEIRAGKPFKILVRRL